MKISYNRQTLGLYAAAFGAAYLWAVAPARQEPSAFAPFRGRYFAHRGLYGTPDKPENSLAAFRAAAASGYGVELDVRLTADGVPVVIHDSDLTRMTGAPGTVEELDYAALSERRLAGSGERIPRFDEVLDILCRAHAPVIVEIKDCRRYRELCKKVLACLDERDGDFCVESFDPRIVTWFRLHAPELVRGFLTTQPEMLQTDPVSSFLSSQVLYNWLCRPHFIAHQTGHRSVSVHLCALLGARKVTWTARDRSEERGSDAVIFERFLPPIHYK